MGAKAREFIDFWVENSVHAVEQFGAPGAEQDTIELTRRCIDMATSLGLSEADLEAEVGDLEAYIKQRLAAVNKLEADRIRER
jgi:hypothetical protein